MIILSSLLLFVSLLSPVQGQKITVVLADSCGFQISTSKTITVTATVDPASGLSVTSVQFEIDGVPSGPPLTLPPFTYVLTPGTNMPAIGCHSVGATATDSNGNTGSNSVQASFKK
jgi:hypothetical protein